MYNFAKIKNFPNALRKRKVTIPNCMKKNGFLFIHVPKCAGTSMLINNFGFQTGHFTYEEYSRSEAMEKLFTFSVVRHPVDRFVSAYNFLMAGGITAKDYEYSEKYMRMTKDVNEFANLLMQQKVPLHVHFRPMHYFLAGDNNQIKLDFILKIETIHSDISRVPNENARKFISNGLTADKKKNVGSGKLQEKVDKSLIMSIYKRDSYLFGYD